MFPSASSTGPFVTDPRHPQGNPRPPVQHSQTQGNMGYNMSAASSGPGFASWGGTSTGGSGGLNDPFAPSRSHYQPGFLMSVNQNNATPPGGQNFEDPPHIPTKFNLSTASPSEFGLESMFDRPNTRRQRQTTSDEDAPPTASINDVIDEPHINSHYRRESPASSANQSTLRRQPNPPQQQQQQPVSSNQFITYLNVFGYPPDRYESVARLFVSLGDTTDPEPNENGMWFTIGFRQPWEAERALRRNGKLMDDSFMIGVARTQTPAADAPPDGPRLGGPSTIPGSPPNADTGSPAKDGLVSAFGLPRSATTSSLGMPLTLAPATAAFRAPTQSKPPPPPQPQPSQGGKVSESSTMSKISDMIFGW